MSENNALWRANVLANHILHSPPPLSNTSLTREVSLQYTPPEVNESYGFNVKEMRKLLDGHNLEERDWLYGIIIQSNLFNPKERGEGKVFVSPDYNETMEQQTEISMKRIMYFLEVHVTIASTALYSAKIGLAVAIRYSLTRRAFSDVATGREILLLDYPSHQRRLLPLLAKTYAMSFAANDLKMTYVKRTPETNKEIHVVSSGIKAVLTWHNMQTLQECREACGGQGVKTENRVAHLKGDYDAQTTFEGDNNVLMQQVSKALFAEYVSCKKSNKTFKGLGLEHMNGPRPVLPTQLTSSTLRCSQFQKNVFCLRERDLLERYACEIEDLQGRGESRQFSFLLSHQLSEDLSKAFTEKAILQAILDAEAKLPVGSIKDVLGLVRSMYALICMEEDPSFLRYGYLSRENVGDVRREVSKLCGELRPHALALVTSFGIPDAFLGPIAFNWVEANAWSSV